MTQAVQVFQKADYGDQAVCISSRTKLQNDRYRHCNSLQLLKHA